MNGADWLRGRGLSGKGVRAGLIDSVGDHRAQVAALLSSLAPDCLVSLDSALSRTYTVASLVAALDRMIGEGVRVISMPFGFRYAVPVLAPLLRRACERGIVLFAAAGNEAGRTLQFPASCPGVIAVGMAELPCQPDPALRAPAWQLPNPLDSLSTLSGASYSCAQVAGLAALLCEAFPHSIGGALIESRGEWRVPDGRCAWQLLESGFVESPLAALPDEHVPVIDARFADSLRYASGSIEGLAVLRQPLPATLPVKVQQVFPNLNACRIEACAREWRELAALCEAIGPVRLSGAQFLPFPF